MLEMVSCRNCISFVYIETHSSKVKLTRVKCLWFGFNEDPVCPIFLYMLIR